MAKTEGTLTKQSQVYAMMNELSYSARQYVVPGPDREFAMDYEATTSQGKTYGVAVELQFWPRTAYIIIECCEHREHASMARSSCSAHPNFVDADLAFAFEGFVSLADRRRFRKYLEPLLESTGGFDIELDIITESLAHQIAATVFETRRELHRERASSLASQRGDSLITRQRRRR